MSYKFKVSETFAEGLRRIGAEQVERASSCLEHGADVHQGVHEARKSLKRLRALLALYRDSLDGDDYRGLDHAFRDIARRLAGAREIQAMLDSLVQLERRFGRAGRNKVLAALRAELDARRAQLTEMACKAAVPDGSMAQIREALTQAGARLALVPTTEEEFDAIRPGLEHTYRAARRWHKRAFEDNTGESFHEWRKILQRHWRHVQLLTPAWPHELRGRVQLLRTICETVGQDHDLTVLDARLAASGRSLGTAAQVRSCRALCRQRQAELRALVHADGEKLFAEGTAAFSRRIGRYWRQTGDAGIKSDDKPANAA